MVTVGGFLKTVLHDSVALAGNFSTSTDSLLVSGGGYSFAGELSGGTLSGEYTGPHGSGAFTLQPSTGNGVKVYVGAYTSQAGQSDGNFNLVVRAGVITGLAVSSGGTKVPLNGSVVGDSISVFVPGSSSVLLAHGSFSDTSHVAAAGVYDDHSSDHGIWSCVLSR